MPSKCGYKPCKRTDLIYSLTRIEGPRMVAKHYCSPIHVALHIVDVWAGEAGKYGVKTIARLLLRAKAILKRVESTARKEWFGTDEKVK